MEAKRQKKASCSHNAELQEKVEENERLRQTLNSLNEEEATLKSQLKNDQLKSAKEDKTKLEESKKAVEARLSELKKDYTLLEGLTTRLEIENAKLSELKAAKEAAENMKAELQQANKNLAKNKVCTYNTYTYYNVYS